MRFRRTLVTIGAVSGLFACGELLSIEEAPSTPDADAGEEAGTADGSTPDSPVCAPCEGGLAACGVGCACVDVRSDPNNCGGCGTTCSAKAGCVGGACEKTVFVTSNAFPGATLGGLAGADAKCAAAAAGAGLTGTYRAWISTKEDGGFPNARLFRSPLPYRRVDGDKVADSYDALVGSELKAPIEATEHGVALDSGVVWTGTNPEGQAIEYLTCESFTAGSGNGRVGLPNVTSSNWTSFTDLPCGMLAALYCFEQ